MTEEEYWVLSRGGAGNTDGWIDKWAMPLSWASKMVVENFNQKDGNEVPKDVKELIVAINTYQKDLVKIITSFENRMPRIQIQAVEIAVWSFIALGVVAGQQDTSRFDVPDLGWAVVILNFPIIEIVKYSLIVGWMKVAIYLQNPFGKDEGYDIDMQEYLDVEIWKASCITNEGKPPL